MTRRKVQLAWIKSDSAKKASLKKRRQSLLKKVKELAVLCGVKAFVIIYSPDEFKPLLWPSSTEVNRLFTELIKVLDVERGNKMIDQEKYLKDRLMKIKENLKKIYKRNKRMEMSELLDEVHGQVKNIKEFQVNEVNGLLWFLNEKYQKVTKRIEYHHQVADLSLQSLNGNIVQENINANFVATANTFNENMAPSSMIHDS
ncbi:agamous-like MADS-box protein AGL80 [Rutidosis leptorrhynchoides]|uniref:agamous-like MADS-box protein AGL80 n=1 Tax=Rutidosis leptorrhynchoides TaxID=125765 RepID=UPI003A9970B9